MKKVSIIVPVYNAENYLPKCLDSIIHQTYKNLEIILINDGSIDRSLEICQQYAERDNRIVVHSIENSGVSIARNIGIDKSTGDYITFVDSDDWAELDMVEFSMEKMSNSNADVVIWSYFKNFPEQERTLSLLPGGDQVFTTEKDLLYLKSIYQFYGEQEIKDAVSAGTTWCKLYTSELIKKNNIRFKRELTRSQDVIFCLEAFSKASLIKYYDKSLYHYRLNNSSTCSGSRFIADTETPFNKLLKEMEEFSWQFDAKEKYTEAINARTVQVIMWHLDHKYFHHYYNKKSVFSRKKNVINLIQNEPYKTALQNVNTNFLPKKERVMVMLFKHNLVVSFYTIYKLHQIYLNMKNKKYD